MVFYFSGTGNSKHVAEEISSHMGERMVYISERTIEENETYEIGENERVGFVFPVYWYTIPTIVEKFMMQLSLSGYEEQYVYTVATYGDAAGNATNRIRQILEQKQMPLHGVFGVKMVDNYMVAYNVVCQDKQRVILADAQLEIEKMIGMIDQREHKVYIKKGMIAALTPLTALAYKKANHTKKFFATQQCNGCRQCEMSCPCNVIHMIDKKPVWEGDCTFCLKCINDCPQSAIQYGKHTQKRERYHYKG